MPENWFLYGIIIGLVALIFSLYWKGIQWKKEKDLFYHGDFVQNDTARDLILNNLPLGICLVSKKGRIIWFNHLFSFLIGKEVVPNADFSTAFPGFVLKQQVRSEKGQELFKKSGLDNLGGKTFCFKTQKFFLYDEEVYLFICQDFTEEIKRAIGNKRYMPVFILVQIDNRAEVLKSMTDEAKPYLQGVIERAFAEWVGKFEGFLSQMGEDRYLIIFTQRSLKEVEKERFTILDKIREIEAGNEVPLTISLGVGMGEDRISSLSRLAQSALDLAQERGGDQAVVKSPEKAWFYGGKSMAAEKKTQVKARITANTLKEMILKSSQVMIMGHEMADYDSLGAAVGIFKATQDLGKKAWIVKDADNPAVDKLFKLLPSSFSNSLVRGQEAARKMQPGTLLVVVDTHKSSLLPEPSLLKTAAKLVVLDHHRRGEEFISEVDLVYLESYASSSCELVTELLQYMDEQVEIGKEEATALLAGITVDTKNFIYQTGVRTFVAASYLRSRGADSAVVQKLLQEDLKTVIQKAEVISKARILYGEIALSTSIEPSATAQLLAAKAADSMLNIIGVNGAIVLWPFAEGVAISARSNGKINVQTIMERLGGGGHLTIAAAKLPDSLEEAEKQLLNVLEDVFQKEVTK